MNEKANLSPRNIAEKNGVLSYKKSASLKRPLWKNRFNFTIDRLMEFRDRNSLCENDSRNSRDKMKQHRKKLKQQILNVLNSNLLENDTIVKKACLTHKKSSSSLMGIEKQLKMHKMVDEKMKHVGITGK